MDKKIQKKAQKLLKIAMKQYAKACKGNVSLEKLESKCNAEYLIQLCSGVLANNPISIQRFERFHFI